MNEDQYKIDLANIIEMFPDIDQEAFRQGYESYHNKLDIDEDNPFDYHENRRACSAWVHGWINGCFPDDGLEW